jgi:predicted acylesterase/phospholipase RssA
MNMIERERPHARGNGAPHRLRSALILAGAAGRGPFAAGALGAVAAHRHRFDVRCVVGVSSGALNAAVYAAGLAIGEAERAARLLTDLWRDRAGLHNIVGHRRRTKIVRDALATFAGAPVLHDVKLHVVAASLPGAGRGAKGDLHTSFEHRFEFGAKELTDRARLDDIADAAVASAAIPGLFKPVVVQTAGPFVDGGLVNNAPIGWALRTSADIDHVIIVTPDAKVAPAVRRFGRFSFGRFIDIVLQERLARDLHEAKSFNRELTRLVRLGVDARTLHRELEWRLLQFVEIRPPQSAVGGILSGFLWRRQREANIDLGRRVGDDVLEQWTETDYAS